MEEINPFLKNIKKISLLFANNAIEQLVILPEQNLLLPLSQALEKIKKYLSDEELLLQQQEQLAQKEPKKEKKILVDFSGESGFSGGIKTTEKTTPLTFLGKLADTVSIAEQSQSSNNNLVSTIGSPLFQKIMKLLQSKEKTDVTDLTNFLADIAKHTPTEPSEIQKAGNFLLKAQQILAGCLYYFSYPKESTSNSTEDSEKKEKALKIYEKFLKLITEKLQTAEEIKKTGQLKTPIENVDKEKVSSKQKINKFKTIIIELECMHYDMLKEITALYESPQAKIPSSNLSINNNDKSIQISENNDQHVEFVNTSSKLELAKFFEAVVDNTFISTARTPLKAWFALITFFSEMRKLSLNNYKFHQYDIFCQLLTLLAKYPNPLLILAEGDQQSKAVTHIFKKMFSAINLTTDLLWQFISIQFSKAEQTFAKPYANALLTTIIPKWKKILNNPVTAFSEKSLFIFDIKNRVTAIDYLARFFFGNTSSLAAISEEINQISASLKTMKNIPTADNLPEGDGYIYVLLQSESEKAPTALYLVDKTQIPAYIQRCNFSKENTINALLKILYPLVENHVYPDISNLSTEQALAITNCTKHSLAQHLADKKFNIDIYQAFILLIAKMIAQSTATRPQFSYQMKNTLEERLLSELFSFIPKFYKQLPALLPTKNLLAISYEVIAIIAQDKKSHLYLTAKKQLKILQLISWAAPVDHFQEGIPLSTQLKSNNITLENILALEQWSKANFSKNIEDSNSYNLSFLNNQNDKSTPIPQTCNYLIFLIVKIGQMLENELNQNVVAGQVKKLIGEMSATNRNLLIARLQIVCPKPLKSNFNKAIYNLQWQPKENKINNQSNLLISNDNQSLEITPTQQLVTQIQEGTNSLKIITDNQQKKQCSVDENFIAALYQSAIHYLQYLKNPKHQKNNNEFDCDLFVDRTASADLHELIKNAKNLLSSFVNLSMTDIYMVAQIYLAQVSGEFFREKICNDNSKASQHLYRYWWPSVNTVMHQILTCLYLLKSGTYKNKKIQQFLKASLSEHSYFGSVTGLEVKTTDEASQNGGSLYTITEAGEKYYQTGQFEKEAFLQTQNDFNFFSIKLHKMQPGDSNLESRNKNQNLLRLPFHGSQSQVMRPSNAFTEIMFTSIGAGDFVPTHPICAWVALLLRDYIDVTFKTRTYSNLIVEIIPTLADRMYDPMMVIGHLLHQLQKFHADSKNVKTAFDEGGHFAALLTVIHAIMIVYSKEYRTFLNNCAQKCSIDKDKIDLLAIAKALCPKSEPTKTNSRFNFSEEKDIPEVLSSSNVQPSSNLLCEIIEDAERGAYCLKDSITYQVFCYAKEHYRENNENKKTDNNNISFLKENSGKSNNNLKIENNNLMQDNNDNEDESIPKLKCIHF